MCESRWKLPRDLPFVGLPLARLAAVSGEEVRRSWPFAFTVVSNARWISKAATVATLCPAKLNVPCVTLVSAVRPLSSAPNQSCAWPS